MDIQEAIGRYLTSGFPIIPLRQGIDSKGKQNKSPIKKNWQNTEVQDSTEEAMRELNFGDETFGVVIPNGFFVLDIDVKDNPNAIDELYEMHPDLPSPAHTLAVQTQSGGLHLYMSCPTELELDQWGNNPAFPFTDSRAARKGYVVGVGSKGYTLHPNSSFSVGFAPIPQSIIDSAEIFDQEQGWDNETLGPYEVVKEGARLNVMNKLGFALANKGAANIWEHLKEQNERHCEPPLSETELKNCVANSLNKKLSEHNKTQYILKEMNMATQMEKLFKDSGIELRYNVRLRKYQAKVTPAPIQWLPPTDGEWINLDDHIIDVLMEKREQIKRGPILVLTAEGEYHWKFRHSQRSEQDTEFERPRSILMQSVRANAYMHRVDPIKDEYLKNLPEWDGTRRIRNFLSSMFELEIPNDFAPEEKDREERYKKVVEWSSYSIFMAGVWRAMSPGCKHDYAVILIGDQGCGKSTLVELLVPDGFHTSNIVLGAPHKNRIEQLEGVWLAEIQEFKASERVEGIKAHMSTAVDKARMAYGQFSEMIPRMSFFIGTTNEESSLPNERQNRRFIPLKIARMEFADTEEKSYEEFIAHIVDVRDQLWAEALHYYNIGEKVSTIPSNVQQYQRGTNDQFRSQNMTIFDAANEIVAMITMTKNPISFPNVEKEVKKKANKNSINSGEQKQIVDALIGAGYERKRVRYQGGIKKLFVREDTDRSLPVWVPGTPVSQQDTEDPNVFVG